MGGIKPTPYHQLGHPIWPWTFEPPDITVISARDWYHHSLIEEDPLSQRGHLIESSISCLGSSSGKRSNQAHALND